VIELTNSISIHSVHPKLQEFEAKKLKGKRVRECSMMTPRLLLLSILAIFAIVVEAVLVR
jgi:hypothetical protein